MSTTSKEEETISQSFDSCEEFISQLSTGTLSADDVKFRLPKMLEVLEGLSKDIQALGLFGDNEFLEELPTSSVKMLLVPCYLAVCYQNLPFDRLNRLQQLKSAKLNFMEFLQRLRSYEVITFRLPWNLESEELDVEEIKIVRPSGDELRNEKLRRLDYDRNIEVSLQRAKEDYQKNPDNDSNLREIYVIKLRQWALRAMAELDQIEVELPFAKRMLDPESARLPGPSSHINQPKLKPFILTRSAAQKKVFGLGYPAIPTVTVDEWAKGMVDHGQWGSLPIDEGSAKRNSDEVDSDSEENRQHQIRMDEYKDTHRRGWGNTHNKG